MERMRLPIFELVIGVLVWVVDLLGEPLDVELLSFCESLNFKTNNEFEPVKRRQIKHF